VAGLPLELDSHPYLAKWLDIEVVSLRLMDERFYHLILVSVPSMAAICSTITGV